MVVSVVLVIVVVVMTVVATVVAVFIREVSVKEIDVGHEKGEVVKQFHVPSDTSECTHFIRHSYRGHKSISDYIDISFRHKLKCSRLKSHIHKQEKFCFPHSIFHMPLTS
jgi:hypothetical protein